MCCDLRVMRDGQGRLPGGGNPELGLEGQVGCDKGEKGLLDQRQHGNHGIRGQEGAEPLVCWGLPCTPDLLLQNKSLRQGVLLI